MDPVISVIVPVYKVEPYLHKCIDSICNQTFQDLEIILVDDESPDRCGQICDAYAAKDSRIRVIHRKNGGLSAARNTGIEIARGEFIGFVDSDDWIEPDMFEFLYNTILRENADIAICGRYEHRDDQVFVCSENDLRTVVSGRDAMKTYLQTIDTVGPIWNKLFRRHIFSEIRFPEGHLWEDTFITARLLDCADTVAFDLQPKYHYLRRPGSITLQGYQAQMWDNTESHAFLYEYVHQKYPDLSTLAIVPGTRVHLHVLNLMITSNSVDKAHKDAILRFLKENRKVILQSPYLSKNKKRILRILNISPWLYRQIILFLSRRR